MAWICKYCSTTNDDADESCIVCDAAKELAGAPVVRTVTPPTPIDGVRTLTKTRVRALGLTGDVVIPYEYNVIGEEAFMGAAITSVVLHENVKKIEKKAFANCSFLKSVTVRGKLSSIGSMAFRNCTALPFSQRPTASRVSGDAFIKGPDSLPDYIPTSISGTTSSTTRSTAAARSTASSVARATSAATTARSTASTATSRTSYTPTRTSYTPIRATTTTTTVRRNKFVEWLSDAADFCGKSARFVLMIAIGSFLVEGLSALVPLLWWRLGLPDGVVWAYSAVTALLVSVPIYLIADHYDLHRPYFDKYAVAAAFFTVYMVQCALIAHIQYRDMSFVSAAAGAVYTLGLLVSCIRGSRWHRKGWALWVGIAVSVVFLLSYAWAVAAYYL